MDDMNNDIILVEMYRLQTELARLRLAYVKSMVVTLILGILIGVLICHIL